MSCNAKECSKQKICPCEMLPGVSLYSTPKAEQHRKENVEQFSKIIESMFLWAEMSAQFLQECADEKEEDGRADPAMTAHIKDYHQLQKELNA